MSTKHHISLTRRTFLRNTAIGVAGTGVGAVSPALWGAPAQTQPAQAKPILPFGKLGKTKHPVTLISFGAILLQDRTSTRVLKAAIDAGVNLVHTSATYNRGKSVEAVGNLFKADKTYRDKVFLCLKSLQPERLAEIDEMLTALDTDHADLVLTEMHNADPRRLEAIQKQMDELRKRKKTRFAGFVCHKDMNDVIEMVLDKAPDFFDASLLAMTMVPDPKRSDAANEQSLRFLKNLKALRAKGVGILSMKSGAKAAVKQGEAVFLPHAKSILEAGADTVLTSMDAFEQVEMVRKLDLKSPHLKPDERERAEAFQHGRAHACLMCDACTKACPQAMPISDLMRFRMYATEYGIPAHARAEYAATGIDFPRLAMQCGPCDRCTNACPVGLAAPAVIRDTLRLLA